MPTRKSELIAPNRPWFDELRQDNHCWVKVHGVDWKITKGLGRYLYEVDSQIGPNWIDLSKLDFEAYTEVAQRLIMEAYR